MNLSSKSALWVTGTLVAILGLCVLFDWTLNINELKSVLPGLTTLKPTTAFSFLLVGLSMIMVPSTREGVALIVKITSSLVVIIGILELVQYLFDFDLGVDDLLFAVPPGASFTDLHPGRMTPYAALEFIFLGGSIFLLRYQRAIYMVQGMTLAGTVIPFAILVSYLFGMSTVPFFSTYKLMGVHTAFGFMVTASGVLAATVESGVFLRLHKYIPKALISSAIAMLFISAIAMIAAIYRIDVSYLSVLKLNNVDARLISETIANTNRTYISLAFTLLIGIGLLLLNLQYLNQEIAKRKRTEDELVHKKALFEAIFESIPDAIVYADKNREVLAINSAFSTIFGFCFDDLAGKKTSFFYESVDEYERQGQIRFNLTADQHSLPYEVRYRRKDGTIFTGETLGTLVKSVSGVIFGYIGVIRDITERRRAEQELRVAATAFDSQEGMIVTDADGTILKANTAFSRITGYSSEDAVGQNPRILSSGYQNKDFYVRMWENIMSSGSWEGEIWNRRKSGEIYPENLTITAVKDNAGNMTHYVAAFSDITLSKASSDEIKNLAFYDHLTGLPNRRLLNDRLTQTMAASKRSGCLGALMFLDLDNFKQLNDTHGHEAGDLLLIEVANRLKSCVREVDTVARLGGDEFVVILNNLKAGKAESTSEAAIVAEKIRASLAEPYALKVQYHERAEPVEHRCTVSIGVALFVNHEASQRDIFKWADAAMYQAKKAGRNLIRFYDEQV